MNSRKMVKNILVLKGNESRQKKNGREGKREGGWEREKEGGWEGKKEGEREVEIT